MKSIKEFKVKIEEEKQDFSKFDALVRAGLANKAQIQRLHTILTKMSSEERPNFSPADKAIVQNLFNKMVDLITNNPQIHRQARKSVNEGVIATSDFKLDALGRKTKAHRIKIGKDHVSDDEGDQEQVKEEVVVLDEAMAKEPPYVLLLKRTSIRLFPNGMKVGIYKSDKLNKEFAIPFSSDSGIIQSEEAENINEEVMDTLHKIVANKTARSVKFSTGETKRVDHWTASAITQVHKALNDANKKKFSDMVHKSPAHFSKAAEFAFSKIK